MSVRRSTSEQGQNSNNSSAGRVDHTVSVAELQQDPHQCSSAKASPKRACSRRLLGVKEETASKGARPTSKSTSEARDPSKQAPAQHGPVLSGGASVMGRREDPGPDRNHAGRSSSPS